MEEETTKEIIIRQPGINSKADILRGPGRPGNRNKSRSKLEKVRKNFPNITHGATAKHLLPWIEEAEKRLFQKIYAMTPHLRQIDAPWVQMVSRNFIKLQMFDEEFRKNGMYNENGQLRDAYRVYWTCQKTTLQIGRSIGMTTESMVKLGIKVGELREAGKRLLEDDDDEE